MIAQNVRRVREKIADEITLVAVTKGVPVKKIKEAIAAGITDIGENRIQEALVKYNEIRNIKWHMVGHLQSNKAKAAVKIFDLIHSVDSLHFAKELDKQAAKINKVSNNVAASNLKRIIVVDDNKKLVGILTIKDLISNL